MIPELEGLFDGPYDDPGLWLCMLRIYLDESVDAATGMCFVAGFMGNRTEWERFVPCWRETLKPRTAIHIADLRLGASNAPRASLLMVYSRGGDSSRTCYGATLFG
jgi:hypothetical protein